MLAPSLACLNHGIRRRLYTRSCAVCCTVNACGVDCPLVYKRGHLVGGVIRVLAIERGTSPCAPNKRMEAVLVVLHRTLLGDLADALPIQR